MAKYDAKKRKTVTQGCGFFKHLGLCLLSFAAGYVTASFYDYTKLQAWVMTHIRTNPPEIMPHKSIEEARLPKPKFEFYTLLTQESQSSTMPSSEHHAEVASSNALSVANLVPSTPSTAPSTSLDMTVPVKDSRAMRDKNVHLASKEEHEPEHHALPLNTSTGSLYARANQTPAVSRETYLVQLASFRRSSDAERMRASLTLKGFNVNVVTVTQQHVSWYRVVLGPFISRTDALRAQSAVARSERIVGMVRKTDV
jgi:cell division protein FtsN